MTGIVLKATTAREARIEASNLFPEGGCTLNGYDIYGECVYITTVRGKGNNFNVATATKNRALRPIYFTVTDDDGATNGKR